MTRTARFIFVACLALATVLGAAGLETPSAAAAAIEPAMAPAADSHACCGDERAPDSAPSHDSRDCCPRDCGKHSCLTSCCRMIVAPAEVSVARLRSVASLHEIALPDVRLHDLSDPNAIFHPPRRA